MLHLPWFQKHSVSYMTDEVLKINHKNLLPIWRRKVENNPIISDVDELARMDMGPQNGFAVGGGATCPDFG